MGVNLRKIEMSQQRRENKQRYLDFVKQLDLTPIMEYFEIGVKAEVFRETSGKILTDRDDLWWGFNNGGYQYTLRREPLNAPQQQFKGVGSMIK